MKANKKVIPRIHLDMDFLQKTRSKMVKIGLCGPISDLQTPIWGHHPMLYFHSQIQRNIVLCYASSHPATTTFNLKAHKRRAHDQVEFKCTFCIFKDSEKSRISLHERRTLGDATSLKSLESQTIQSTNIPKIALVLQ